MDDSTTKHLMDLYGLNPNILPYAFQFPRIPPRLTPLTFTSTTESVRKNFSRQNESLSTKLQDFQRTYQKYASSLFDMTFLGIVPPGHPLFSRQFSVEVIKSERDQLQKENLELKKQVEKISKEKQHQN
ncbi:MAG: hypothetical protein NPMRTH1_1610019 [Nitrosopumilales archaeon]|nr:MAG: hypothetical protein NPMRTH1_1610019 [Nitrosopumilales archaeon]